MSDPVYDKGLATRRAVLGNDYVQGALDRATDFTRPLQDLVTRHAWGNTWQRDGIDLKTRSIVTVSMLVALGRMHELKIHVRGALNNGVTPAELAGGGPGRPSGPRMTPYGPIGYPLGSLQDGAASLERLIRQIVRGENRRAGDAGAFAPRW